jgi:hypothetical protein
MRDSLTERIPSRWQPVVRIDGPLIGAAVVFLIAVGIYGATLLRGVSSFDVAEMQTVPAVLGITHPTGYPLFTMLGFIWTRLPIGSGALEMNLLSAILFALSAAGLTVLATKLGVRPALAAGAGLVFAFAGETWARATEAEVHSLHTLLVVLLLLAWVTAEQRNSPRAALAMLLVAGIGLAHHRLMLLTASPIVLWFFLRHASFLRSVRVVGLGVAAVVVPLLTYLYIPLRAGENPKVVNSDTSTGWLAIARGEAFSGNESAFSGASPGRWLDHLPTYASFARDWLGWPVVLLALIGAVELARREPAILVGLALIVAVTTYGLANRLDRDYRWLIVPLLITSLSAAVGTEGLLRLLLKASGAQWSDFAELAVVVGFALVPTIAVIQHYHTYDRSGDNRDATNADGILSVLAPNAVVWSYWDVRTTLEYETAVAHRRPDVDVLDHRAYARYGCPNCAAVGGVPIAIGMVHDPAFAGRPTYFVPVSDAQKAEVAKQLNVRPVIQIDLPYGFDQRGTGWLYLLSSR